MKFKFDHMSQTQLGMLFGVSSHVIGERLTAIGLREGGTPTKQALEGRYCKQAITAEKGSICVWDSEKTVNALNAAGHLMKLDPPQTLVLPTILNGPFTVRKTESQICVIANVDGSDCIRTNNKMTGDVVAEILNLAHSKGVIDRKCQPQRLLQATVASSAEVDRIIVPFE